MLKPAEAIMDDVIFSCVYQDKPQNALGHFKSFFELPKANFEEESLEILLKDCVYKRNLVVEEIDDVFRILRRDWFQLQNLVLSDNPVTCGELSRAREEINRCFRNVIECIKFCESDMLKAKYINCTMIKLKIFYRMILSVEQLDEELKTKQLLPLLIQSDRSPLHQYFHAFLEMHYHLLLLYYTCGKFNEFENHFKRILKDLLWLSKRKFSQKNLTTIFLCDCHKDFWLIMQLLCEKILGVDTFWKFFNESVREQEQAFILWILKDVANLQGLNAYGQQVGNASERIVPNYPLLETSLKEVLPASKQLSQTFTLIEPLICHLWLRSGRIEVYQTLWEHFSKRLNYSSRSAMDYSLTELVDMIDKILWSPAEDCEEDFEMFLGMLVKHLDEHPHHWAKMKGRIYSQLGPNKIREMNDIGTFHVLLLYTTLTRISFEELSKKFVSFVEALPDDKRQSQLVWTFYAAFIVRHVKENRSIQSVTNPMVKMLADASQDQKSFHLIKNFTANFDSILRLSTNYQLHQWLLLNDWLYKYMATCYYSDLNDLLKILLDCFDRINSSQVWCEWEPSFKHYVYPTLKYICSSLSGPEQGGKLAAKICLLTPSLCPEAFSFFNSEGIVPRVSQGFLCAILNEYPNSFILSQSQETLALQSWIKVCLLTKDNYEKITSMIVKLDSIPNNMKARLATSRDPLCAFIEALGEDVNRVSVENSKLCETCFGETDRWITQYFTQPENEAVVLRVYTCIALAFYKIGHLMYNRHKSSGPFTRLTTVMLLSTELMIGKQPHQYILQAIKKTWHLFFEATLKLSAPNDTFIDRTLKELVVKFVPHFSIIDSPFFKCLDNEETAGIVLDKMSTAFFKQPTKEAESNIFKSLRIVSDFVQGTTSVPALKLVVDKTLFGLFEVVMFHTQRNAALAIIKTLTSSPLYPNVKTDFGEVVVLITAKHLAFSTGQYFQLMGILAKFVPNDVKVWLGKIKQQVSVVERMRGVGFDRNLRLHLEKLESVL